MLRKPNANAIAVPYSHFELLLRMKLTTQKYTSVQKKMSNELGWYKIFMRSNAENKIAKAPNTRANNLPPNASVAFHTTIIVKQPKSAGKNFTQNTPLPNNLMIYDIHEVNGGTEIKPHARWLPWSR